MYSIFPSFSTNFVTQKYVWKIFLPIDLKRLQKLSWCQTKTFPSFITLRYTICYFILITAKADFSSAMPSYIWYEYIYIHIYYTIVISVQQRQRQMWLPIAIPSDKKFYQLIHFLSLKFLRGSWLRVGKHERMKSMTKSCFPYFLRVKRGLSAFVPFPFFHCMNDSCYAPSTHQPSSQPVLQ